MRNGFPILFSLIVLNVPGCAAMVATTEAVKVVGKTTVGAVKTTTKVVTRPFRDAIDRQKAKQVAKPDPVMTVSHGDSRAVGPAKPRRKTGDAEVELAGASDEEDTHAPDRAATSSGEKAGAKKSRARQASKKKDEDDESLDDGEKVTASGPSPKKSPWKGQVEKSAARPRSDDPDTIRIE